MTRTHWFALAALAGIAACAPRDTTPRITVEQAVFVPGAGVAPAVIYATFANAGGADTLVAIESDAADTITIHVTMTDSAGRMMMHPGAALPVPMRGTAHLAPGATHGMASGLHGQFVRGDSITITFRFARQGTVGVRAAVIDHAQVDSATTPARR